MQKSLEKIQEVASILASHAEDVGDIRPGSPPDVEADFDALMSTRNIMGSLRAMSSTKIVHLATYARQRAMAEAEAGRAEVEAQLSAACPPRSVRDFRMVRVRDGREGLKEPARTGMLNVWDAKVLGNELKEGRRFLVSS
jgi:breast cancer 2 susceptibility protein